MDFDIYLADEEYDSWSDRYHAATVSMNDRDAEIEAVSSELEKDLRLLGATAIEDRLQDGVPETIADLKRAGIKVWVATGDKLETAIGMDYSTMIVTFLFEFCYLAIGHSTNLIGKDSNMIVIRGGNESYRPVYRQMIQAVEDFFPESDILNGRDHISSPPDGQEHTLQRFDTGVTSIVGSNNGDRPGGFVLVIEGTALGYVSYSRLRRSSDLTFNVFRC